MLPGFGEYFVLRQNAVAHFCENVDRAGSGGFRTILDALHNILGNLYRHHTGSGTRYSKKWTLRLFFALAILLLWAKDEYYLCVVLGVLLAYLMESNVLSDSRRIRWLALIPLAAGLYLGGYPSYAQPVFFYRYLGKICAHIYAGKGIATYHVLAAGLLILGIIMCAPVQRWLSARPLQWLGSISMGVFVLHVTVMQFLGRPLQKLFLGMGMSYALMVLIVYLILLPALLLLAWGFHNTVERLLNKLLSRF